MLCCGVLWCAALYCCALPYPSIALSYFGAVIFWSLTSCRLLVFLLLTIYLLSTLMISCDLIILHIMYMSCFCFLSFKKGAFQMAKAAGVKIIPVSIGNLHRWQTLLQLLLLLSLLSLLWVSSPVCLVTALSYRLQLTCCQLNLNLRIRLLLNKNKWYFSDGCHQVHCCH